MKKSHLISIIGAAIGILPIVKGIFLYLHSIEIMDPAQWTQIVRFTSMAGRNTLSQEYIWTKPLPDLTLLIVVFGFVVLVVNNRRVAIPAWPTFILFLAIVGYAFLSTALQSPLLAIVGLRALSPLALFFVAYNCFDERSFDRISSVVIIVAVLAGMLGILQEQIATLVVPGTFSIFFFPNSFVVFQLTALALLLARSPPPSRIATVGALLAWSIIGSDSTIGLLGLVGIILGWGLVNFKLEILLGLLGIFAAGGTVVTAFLIQVALSQPLKVGALRNELPSVFNSGMNRLEILLSSIRNLEGIELVLGKGIGYGTNTAVNLARFLGSSIAGVVITDSLYTSLLIQLGVLGLAVFVLFNLRVLIVACAGERRFVNDAIVMFVPLFFLFALGQNILEFFPVNWIYWLLLGTFMGTVRSPPATPPGQSATNTRDDVE